MSRWSTSVLSVALLSGSLVLLSQGLSTPAYAARPDVGTLAFDQPATGQAPGLGSRRDLVVIHDGQRTQLTHNVADADGYIPSDYGPSLSPDAASLAYTHCEHATFGGGMVRRGGHSPAIYDDPNDVCSLWVMDVDGSGAHQMASGGQPITITGWTTSDFDWGPGGKIAYTDRGDAHVYDPATGGVTTVASSASSPYWYTARWLGDTSLVLQGGGQDQYGDPTYGPHDIWTVHTDGSSLTNRTSTTKADEDYAVGSDDGSLLSFVGADAYGNRVPYVMKAGGTTRTEITTGSTYYPDVINVGWSTDLDHYGLLVGDTDGAMSFAVTPVGSSADPATVVDLVDEPGIDWHGDVDSAPVASDQTVQVPADQATAVDLSGHDPDGDPMTFAVGDQPQHGVLSGTAPHLTYTPTTGYSGLDTFTFSITANGKTSNVATVTLQVDGRADLAASIRGVGERTHVGLVDVAKATVTNQGSSPALGVELRLGVPRGLQYGYVRKPGSTWRCSLLATRFIHCSAPSLAPGASATLSAGLFAQKKQTDRVRVAVRALASTPDPATDNNYVAALQKIRTVQRPPAPPSGRLDARRDTGWQQVNVKYNLWVRTTNVYLGGSTNPNVVQGAVAATMWAWAGPTSKVVRFKFKHIWDQSGGGLGWSNLSMGFAISVPDDSHQHMAWFPHQFTLDPDGGFDGHQVGKWKFVRRGVYRNFSYKADLI